MNRYNLFFLFIILIYGCKEKTEKKSTLKSYNLVEDTSHIKKIDSFHLKHNRDTLKTPLVLEKDLCYVKYFLDNKGNSNDNEFCIKKRIKLKLIDKRTFLTYSKSKKNYSIEKKTVKKKNGVIELLTQEGKITFVDKPDDEEKMVVFNYIGEINFLQKYILNRQFWEDSDYVLIDKNDGKMHKNLISFPYISPNTKFLVCLNSNLYEKQAELVKYNIKNNKIDFDFSLNFTRWMPAVEPYEIFWITNDTIVVKFLSAKYYWKKNGFYNDEFQYLSITFI